MRCQKNMAKKLIDANAILRYLLNDVETMAAESAKVIQNGAFTISEVLAEVVYVLMKVYKVERQEISKVLIIFLDCILIAYNETDSTEIFTFDKKLNKRLKKHSQGEN